MCAYARELSFYKILFVSRRYFSLSLSLSIHVLFVIVAVVVAVIVIVLVVVLVAVSLDSKRRTNYPRAVLVDSNAKSVSPNLSLSFERPIGMHYQWF